MALLRPIAGPDDPAFDALLTALEPLAADADRTWRWPAEQFELFRQAGVLGWSIPAEYGGRGWSEADIARGYERLAGACLASVFILTQRDGACRRIASSDAEEMKRELLPRLATGERFATVGISHLTTSRQHVARPAVEAVESDGAYVLSGSIPWVTGAAHADYVVTGATIAGSASRARPASGAVAESQGAARESGGTQEGAARESGRTEGGFARLAGPTEARQILIALPTELPGVEVGEPAELVALTETQTAEVRVQDVVVPAKFLLAGPVPHVMTSGQGARTGGLETSALAIGLAGAAVRSLARYAADRPELSDAAEQLAAEHEALQEDFHRAPLACRDAGGPGDGTVDPMAIRTRANGLVLRATQANLAAAKGAGFLAGHQAGRWARQALFFLVWSCPQPVLEATLEELVC